MVKQTGYIYSIYNPRMDKYYIGATFQSLNECLINIMKDCYKFNNKGYGKYRRVYDIMQPGVKIHKLEEIKGNTIKDLNHRKNIFIVNTNCINNKPSTLTSKEYSKRYRERHPEKNKEKCKRYREQNREKILQYEREYRKKNAKRIFERNERKCICDICGEEYVFRNKRYHIKSKYHLKHAT